jgi:hypothetical protein
VGGEGGPQRKGVLCGSQHQVDFLDETQLIKRKKGKREEKEEKRHSPLILFLINHIEIEREGRNERGKGKEEDE